MFTILSVIIKESFAHGDLMPNIHWLEVSYEVDILRERVIYSQMINGRPLIYLAKFTC